MARKPARTRAGTQASKRASEQKTREGRITMTESGFDWARLGGDGIIGFLDPAFFCFGFLAYFRA